MFTQPQCYGSRHSPIRDSATSDQLVLVEEGGSVFALGCFMFGLRWVIESLLHWEHEPFIRALIMPVVLGAVFAFRPARRWFPRGGSVIIGEDFIEGRTQYNWYTFKKRISREKIKSISENKRGLCVMDRGKFAARMLGFVFVPATMPEYQQIRSELAQWAPIK